MLIYQKKLMELGFWNCSKALNNILSQLIKIEKLRKEMVLMNKEFGIIGLGNMGSAHIRNFKSGSIRNAEITAVCDTKTDKLQCTSKKFLGDSVAF